MPDDPSHHDERRHQRGRHVDRVPDPGDGRSWRPWLTEAGAAAHAGAAARSLPALWRGDQASAAEAPAVTRALRSLRCTLDVALASRPPDPLEAR